MTAMIMDSFPFTTTDYDDRLGRAYADCSRWHDRLGGLADPEFWFDSGADGGVFFRVLGRSLVG